MSKKLLTPAEIERATVERCANLCEVRAGYHAGGNEYRQWESKDCADAIRALPPMFGDVPAYSVANDFRAWDAVHMKTGNVYRVVGEAIDATNAHSSRPMVIYQRDGKTYVRCAEEFIEKFKAISAAPTAGQEAAKDAAPVELITEREMAIREARKSARLMLTEEGHEVVCIEPQLWEAICSRAAGQAAAKDAAAVDKDSDGWIKWEGGECPVPDDTLVEVKFECGDSNRFLHASRWDWSHGDDTGYDIVSYRVLAAAPEVK